MSYNAENRKIKANDTKQKIYESAATLFSFEDYNKVSVDSIVKMAGVSKGSFYVHFASKDALVTALTSNYVAKADTDYKNFLDSFSDDVPVGVVLLSLIGKIVDVLIEKIGCEKMRAVYKALIAKDVDTSAVTSYNRELYKMFSDLLERGIRQGEFKSDIPLDLLTMHLMMAIRGITYEWCMRYPDFDYKTQALQHFEIILKGLHNPSALSMK